MTAKITISLPDAVLARVRAAVERGEAESVSGFIAHAIEEVLDPLTPEQLEARWVEEYGPIPPEVQRETDEFLDSLGLPPDPRPGRGAS